MLTVQLCIICLAVPCKLIPKFTIVYKWSNSTPSTSSSGTYCILLKGQINKFLCAQEGCAEKFYISFKAAWGVKSTNLSAHLLLMCSPGTFFGNIEREGQGVTHQVKYYIFQKIIKWFWFINYWVVISSRIVNGYGMHTIHKNKSPSLLYSGF